MRTQQIKAGTKRSMSGSFPDRKAGPYLKALRKRQITIEKPKDCDEEEGKRPGFALFFPPPSFPGHPPAGKAAYYGKDTEKERQTCCTPGTDQVGANRSAGQGDHPKKGDPRPSGPDSPGQVHKPHDKGKDKGIEPEKEQDQDKAPDPAGGICRCHKNPSFRSVRSVSHQRVYRTAGWQARSDIPVLLLTATPYLLH